jgi:SAM-dependent methyltransferase
MRLRLLDLLHCPSDGGQLRVDVFEERRGEIIDGLLTCESCQASFCIDGGIPRFVGPAFYDDRSFRARYGRESKTSDSRAVHPTAKGTSTSFGFEWHEYATFGWEGETFGPAYTQLVFEKQLFFEPRDMEDKLVLDGGCGNGRYTHMATRFGARDAVGCDISSAVEVAYKNLAGTENAHIVQADIFNLPFPPRTFDVVFSIGVLHHTGDTERAFNGLVTLLKPGGTISVDVYRRMGWVNETVDSLLRSVTTKMDRRRLLAISKGVSRVLTPLDRLRYRHISALRLLSNFARLESHHHMLFDWYSAPHADRHRPSELAGWFEKNGIELTKSSWDARSFSAIQKLRRWVLPDGGMGARGVRHSE